MGEYAVMAATLAATAVILYILWINGLLTVKFSRALTFSGVIAGGSGCKAKFRRCTGSIKRVVKFEPGGEYRFSFEPELTDGRMWVELLGSKKRQLLCLNGSRQNAVFTAEEKRGYLVLHFDHASGGFGLGWERT